MRNKFTNTLVATATLTTALFAAAAAQTPAPSSGETCRAAWSAFASAKEFGFVWVRINADDTGDVWTAPGSALPPESIPATPPGSATHQNEGRVSHFGTTVVGVTYQPKTGKPIMIMVDKQNKMMSTVRQKMPMACTP